MVVSFAAIVIFVSSFLNSGSSSRCLRSAKSEWQDALLLPCIANCLALNDFKQEKHACIYNHSNGRYLEHVCNKDHNQRSQHEINSRNILACSWDEQVEVIGIKFNFNLTPSVINKLCTHILFGSWFQYNLESHEIIPRNQIINTQQREKLFAQSHGVQAVMTFGTELNEFGMSAAAISMVLGKVGLRRKFVANLFALLQNFDFNGLCFKWVVSTCPMNECKAEDTNNFVLFMRELGQLMKKDNKSLFLWLPEYTMDLRWFDLTSLSKNIDYFITPWSANTQNSDTLHPKIASKNALLTYLKTVKAYLKGKNMHKLLMGHCALIANQPLLTPGAEVKFGTPINQTSVGKWTDWGTACKKFSLDNYTLKRAIFSDQQFIIAHSDNNAITYESNEQIIAKLDTYRSFGIGGLVFSYMFLDDETGECGCGAMPRLTAIVKIWKRNACIVNECPRIK